MPAILMSDKWKLKQILTSYEMWNLVMNDWNFLALCNLPMERIISFMKLFLVQKLKIHVF